MLIGHMRYIESDTVIGLVMREHRTKTTIGWTQTQLADKLQQYTGSHWDQSKVSDAEHGRYQFTVTDLMAIGYIFGVPPIRFLHTDVHDLDFRIRFGQLDIKEGELLYHIIQGRLDRPSDKNRLTKGIDPDTIKPSPLRETILKAIEEGHG
jgi:transcriptional regulator with XRE-family HTH domain